MPFGAGKRACVGMGLAFLELQLITLEMAASFDFTCKNEGRIPKPHTGITLNAPPIENRILPRANF